ncbi:hypothetical protein DFH28DRAFT_1177059 [Melampsora americana]|nr:hypothetical protein DFH28DRAFT_1177059 [Melampsora americana]
MSLSFVSFDQANHDDHFLQVTSGANMGQWRCKLCTNRSFKDRARHSKLLTHVDRVRLALQRTSASRTAVLTPGLQDQIPKDQIPNTNEEPLSPIHPERGFQSPSSATDPNDPPIFDNDEDMASISDDLASLYDPTNHTDFDIAQSRRSSIDMEEFLAQPDDESATSSAIEEDEPNASAIETWLPWYPLRKKEVCPSFGSESEHCITQIDTQVLLLPNKHAAALMMMGTGRNLMSTAEYNRIRSIIKLVLKVDLPDLGHIKKIRNELKARLGLQILERTSPLGNPCFTISVCDVISQELGNPQVAPHIEFLPENDDGVTVDRYSQSKKWRECLSRNVRPQMVDIEGEHFYIYEPAQLEDSRVVVPVFFYKDDSTVRAKCLEVVPGPRGSHDFLISEEPGFDCKTFLDIDVQTFTTSFLQIKLGNGQDWCESRNTRLLQNCEMGVRPITLPNPWRVKANGMLIRSVPIALYSDDTSGNVSKKWNKHMSFYFTLAGLRPKLTNQEYHIHPLCTSNVANALEQGDQIVDELNQAAITGFRAFDCSVQKDVLVIPFVLCHMGDSPMHAEISNTTNPSGTLSPCRICDLTVESRADKQTKRYVQRFVGIDQNGLPAALPLRNWERTKDQTKRLWQLTRNPKSIKQFDDLSKSYGTRDSLNLPFAKEIQQLYRSNKNKRLEDQTSQNEIIRHCESLDERFGDRLFNPFLRLTGFDGHADTPVESLHVILLGVTKYMYRDMISKLTPTELVTIQGRWESFQISGLNVAPIQSRNMVHYANSLLGKDFCVVLQAAPFVFFEFLADDYRHCWISLAHLSSYIFQTWIFHKQAYLSDLKIVVARFLNQLVHLTAQWTNKPKFHMLTHLSFSVDRFGPPSLFLTEKMEAQNGVTRIASVHSNRHAPGKDISNTFNNRRLVRMLISGSSFFDSKLGLRATASPLIREMFNTKEIRHSLGLHLPLSPEAQLKTKVKYKYSKNNRSGPHSDTPPEDLRMRWPHSHWETLLHVVLENNHKVVKGSFLLIDFDVNSNTCAKVGRVASIWQQVESNQVFLALKKCRLRGLHPFYGMREVTETEQEAWIQTKNISCILNIQHNCHDAQCAVSKSKSYRIERLEARKKQPEVSHKDVNSFIVNAGALYSAEYHRHVTKHVWSEVTPAEWEVSITEGLSAWFEKCPPKGVGQDAIDDDAMVEDIPLLDYAVA